MYGMLNKSNEGFQVVLWRLRVAFVWMSCQGFVCYLWGFCESVVKVVLIPIMMVFLIVCLSSCFRLGFSLCFKGVEKRAGRVGGQEGLTVCLSVCLCLSLSVSVCLCLSLSVSPLCILVVFFLIDTRLSWASVIMTGTRRLSFCDHDGHRIDCCIMTGTGRQSFCHHDGHRIDLPVDHVIMVGAGSGSTILSPVIAPKTHDRLFFMINTGRSFLRLV